MSFVISSQYQQWLGRRKDNSTNRRLYAKEHFGNMGRDNITGMETNVKSKLLTWCV